MLFGESVPQVRLDGSVGGHPRRPRLLQHRRHHPARRRHVGAHRSAHRGGRAHARSLRPGAPSARSPGRSCGRRSSRRPRSSSSSRVTSFGVVLLLGGPRDTTLEVEIYRQTAILLDLPTAAALTILQMAGVVVLLLASARAQEGLAVQQRLRGSRRDRAPSPAGPRAAPGRAHPGRHGRVHVHAPGGAGGALAAKRRRLRLGGVRLAARGRPAHASQRRPLASRCWTRSPSPRPPRSSPGPWACWRPPWWATDAAGSRAGWTRW